MFIESSMYLYKEHTKKGLCVLDIEQSFLWFLLHPQNVTKTTFHSKKTLKQCKLKQCKRKNVMTTRVVWTTRLVLTTQWCL